MGNSEINEEKNEHRATERRDNERRDSEQQERLAARRTAELRAAAERQQPTESRPEGERSPVSSSDSMARIRRETARREAQANGDAPESSTRSGRRGGQESVAEAAEHERRSLAAERTAYRPDEIVRLRAGKEGARLEQERRQDAHEANYLEMREKAVRSEVEFGEPQEAYVKVDDILTPERAGDTTKPDDAEFWTRHGNTKEFYDGMAEKYPRLRERLARGEDLDEIKKDEEMRVAAEFWYGGRGRVQLEKYKDSYFIDSGYHRYHLGRKFNLGEIPASVREAREKEQRDV
jgi:hypothetical protein